LIASSSQLGVGAYDRCGIGRSGDGARFLVTAANTHDMKAATTTLDSLAVRGPD